VRVGLFTPNYPGVTGEGGIGTYTHHLAQGLSALGHSVHVVTPAPAMGGARDGDVRLHLVPTRHFPVLERFLPGSGACYRVGRSLQAIVSRHRLDLVEFPNWEGLGVLFCWFRRVPVVVRLHTSSLETQRIDGVARGGVAKWDVRRERWLARSADTLVTHSRAHRAMMADELQVPESRIRVVPHGVAVAPEFRKPARAGDAPTVVYLGRMEKRKGTLDLLRAVPQVLREVPRARFVLIGADRPHCPGGRTHAEFVRQELPAEVRDRVTLLGRLPDAEVDRWLQQADVFVAPSLYESFGLVFIEAMRWGTPVVGTTAGGIPEIIEDGKTGLLVPPSSPAELAGAVAGLLRNDARRCRLGEAGRRLVENTFSTEVMARNVEALYRQTIGEWQRGERQRA
jgi:glycogen(starch) synthase